MKNMVFGLLFRLLGYLLGYKNVMVVTHPKNGNILIFADSLGSLQQYVNQDMPDR